MQSQAIAFVALSMHFHLLLEYYPSSLTAHLVHWLAGLLSPSAKPGLNSATQQPMSHTVQGVTICQCVYLLLLLLILE